MDQGQSLFLIFPARLDYATRAGYLCIFWGLAEKCRERSAEMAEMDRSRVYHNAAQPVRARTPLQHVEDRFRLLVEAVQDYAIFMLDSEGRITSWNLGAERIKGYPAQEIIGQHVSVFYPEEDRRASKPQKQLELAAKHGYFSEENWRVRKDASRFWALTTITALRDQHGQLYGYGTVTRDCSDHHHAEAERSDRRHAEAERLGEERFRILVEEVRDYAIFMLDPTGHIISWNRGAERIKGYREEEILGKHFSTFYPQADRDAKKPEKELEIATRDGRIEDEGWRVRKDGSMFWANVIITALRDSSGQLIGFGKVTRDITEKMRAEGALRQSNEELEQQVAERMNAEERLHESEDSLRRLSLSLLKTQDEERRRIGRELHDSVGQFLAALKMNLDSLCAAVDPESGEAGDILRQCAELAAESIKEVRTISYLLYPPMLEESGLQSAIQWYLDGFSKRSGIEVKIAAAANFGRMSRDAELAMFRVLQESLTNVHRHSGSATAEVALRMNEGHVILEVRDNGKGIPAEILEEARKDSFGAFGVGLRGMKERMRQLGGDLELTASAKGTTVTAIIPADSLRAE